MGRLRVPPARAGFGAVRLRSESNEGGQMQRRTPWLDPRFAEMYVPGGEVESPDVIPWLADHECSGCGQIGRCAPGCEKEVGVTDMLDDLAVKRCKVDGCENTAAARMGRYAGLCEEHRNGNGKTEPASEPVVAITPDEP